MSHGGGGFTQPPVPSREGLGDDETATQQQCRNKSLLLWRAWSWGQEAVI